MAESKYLLVKGRAGLGNRILCLLTAVLYARFTRRRLLVDWSDSTYSNDGSNAVHEYFRSPMFSPSDEIPDTQSVRPAIWQNHLQETAQGMELIHVPRCVEDPMAWRKFSVDLARIDYQEEVLVMWTYFPLIDHLRQHFRGEFSQLRRLTTEAILHRLMRESLQLHPSIQERVAQIRASWPARPTVGVHVRYRDKKTRLDALRGEVGKLLASHSDLQVFLATDNPDVEATFRRTHPGVLTTPKWYPADEKAMHGSASCQDRKTNGVEALTDLYLLAGCDHLVLDRSSAFSCLAALLSLQTPDRIYDVRFGKALPPRLRHTLWRLKNSVQWGGRRFLTKLGV